MKLSIRFRQLAPTPALREQITRRVHFALGRLAGDVRRVSVTVADVDGPRGGLGTQCRVRLDGPHLGPIVVDQLGVGVLPTVTEVVERAARAAVRALRRRRDVTPSLAVG